VRRGSVWRRESGSVTAVRRHGNEDDDAPSAGGVEDRAGAGGTPRRGVLRPTLTPPEVVPMSAEQHRQAVDVLAAMIVDWWRREARNAMGDTTTDGRSPTVRTATRSCTFSTRAIACRRVDRWRARRHVADSAGRRVATSLSPDLRESCDATGGCCAPSSPTTCRQRSPPSPMPRTTITTTLSSPRRPKPAGSSPTVTSGWLVTARHWKPVPTQHSSPSGPPRSPPPAPPPTSSSATPPAPNPAA